MATPILQDATSKGTGTWTQVDSSTPTYCKVVIKGDRAKVLIRSSETDGSGQGGQSVVEAQFFHSGSVVLPAGSYYINAEVVEAEDVTVDVVAQP